LFYYFAQLSEKLKCAPKIFTYFDFYHAIIDQNTPDEFEPKKLFRALFQIYIT